MESSAHSEWSAEHPEFFPDRWVLEQRRLFYCLSRAITAEQAWWEERTIWRATRLAGCPRSAHRVRPEFSDTFKEWIADKKLGSAPGAGVVPGGTRGRTVRAQRVSGVFPGIAAYRDPAQRGSVNDLLSEGRSYVLGQ